MPCTTITQRRRYLPPWTRIDPEELAQAIPRVQAIAEKITRALDLPGTPAAQVQASLQTTGRLLVRLCGREPVLNDKTVCWTVPMKAGYLPLTASTRWFGDNTAEEALQALASHGLERASRNANYADRLSGLESHAPVNAPAIHVTPRRYRSKRRPGVDFTVPLCEIARDLSRGHPLSDVD